MCIRDRGWDVNAFDSGSAFDLDAAAFLVGANGKCPTERDFIFYGNLKHSTGAVEHLGDNLTGEGDGDDEQILVLSLIHISHTVASRSCICVGQPGSRPHLFCTHLIKTFFVLQVVLRSCNITVTFQA